MSTCLVCACVGDVGARSTARLSHWQQQRSERKSASPHQSLSTCLMSVVKTPPNFFQIACLCNLYVALYLSTGIINCEKLRRVPPSISYHHINKQKGISHNIIGIEAGDTLICMVTEEKCLSGQSNALQFLKILLY